MPTNENESREQIGGNFPPLGKLIADQDDIPGAAVAYLEDEYRTLSPGISAMLARARLVPAVIESEADLGTAAKLIKELRDEAAKAEALRVKEGEPYHRGKQAVDNFFFPLIEKCRRRDRKDRPGAADVLQARVDDYQQRKLAAEQERRRQEAEKEARIAREAQERADREAREAEEKRLAAERARKPENIETKGAVASQAETQAAASTAEAARATSKAEEAHVNTLARPADMVRTRVAEGPTVTMATEPYAVIEDDRLLDKEKLWPFIALDAKEKALRSWAKTTGHTEGMSGARVGKRPKTVVR